MSLRWIIPGTVVTALFFIFVIGKGIGAQLNRSAPAPEAILGQDGAKRNRALTRQGGKVFIEGEYWNAVSDTPVEVGRPVEIVGIHRSDLESETKKPINGETLWNN